MLLGQVIYKVGQKHRLAIPKQFRKELGDHCILTRGYEGCLLLVSSSDWSELTQELTKGSFFDLSVRQSSRLLLGSAFEIHCDDQGRFVVPPTLYDSTIHHQEVAFVGLGRWVEIWDIQAWTELDKQLQAYGTEIGQRLAQLSYHHSGGTQ